MPKKHITIIGAGQAGLQLGIGLLKNNFEVTIYTEKTPAEIQESCPTSSQAMFHTALMNEKNLGLNFWDNVAPINLDVSFTLGIEKNIVFSWKKQSSHYFQSIDQRIKFPKWMSYFEGLGGELVFKKTEIADLEILSKKSDLIVIATGKGQIGKIFKREGKLSPFDKPQRKLGLAYVYKSKNHSGVRFNTMPGIGEFFALKGLGLHGPCDMILFEGVTSGPFDCWENINNAAHFLENSLRLLKQYAPWEYPNFKDAEPISTNSILCGAITPTIREPLAKLNNNSYVLGIADAISLNDPIAGQGSNNASKSATLLLNSITSHHPKEFDYGWLKKTSSLIKNSTRFSSIWSNILLNPPQHVQELFKQASINDSLSYLLTNALDNPDILFPWILSSKKTIELINKLSSAKYYTPLQIKTLSNQLTKSSQAHL